ncbi:DUF4097 family beta strand repeat-containing protein [Luteimonas sp. RD2P54]|uniref:DUF4097 family beta strand repeat-containing protein n=1 Tax=Luteimonas endophytica TaxID=3042023 RepID=A0ABT6JAV3_9GAMM|nr:DUF4097 family beta strand repeat-containing protein [Luteimonas endophytica]MDH5823732.1 DUF4097 family beta strand repeat-containing protein [Luteimonas endophytica]
MDILAARARPRRNFGALALLLAACAPFAALAQSAVDERHPLAPGGRVEVENVAGAIRVQGWDRDEVTVVGTLGEGLRLEVDASRNRVRVHVVYPRGRRNNGDARLELRVPKGAELEVATVSADVDIAGVDLRRLQARTVSGGLNAAGRAGEADLGSVSGSIRSRIATSRFEAGTVSGRVDAGGGLGGDVSAESVSGSVDLVAGRVEQLRAETVSGSVKMQVEALAPGGRIAAEAVSGRITLELPANASAQLRASSFSGDIHSSVGQVQRRRHGPGRSLDATLGGGDGDISLQSHSGNVRVTLGAR